MRARVSVAALVLSAVAVAVAGAPDAAACRPHGEKGIQTCKDMREEWPVWVETDPPEPEPTKPPKPQPAPTPTPGPGTLAVTG